MPKLKEFLNRDFDAVFSVWDRWPSRVGGTKFKCGLDVPVFEAGERWSCLSDSEEDRARFLQLCWQEGATTYKNVLPLSANRRYAAAMASYYARFNTVSRVRVEKSAGYRGGLVLPWLPHYVADGPFAIFDFVSMYPALACLLNAGKNTWYSAEESKALEQQGLPRWDLEEHGGFLAKRVRDGALAFVVRDGLRERLACKLDRRDRFLARALKREINAAVGMMGSKTGPFSDERVAGCITFLGRELLDVCWKAVRPLKVFGGMHRLAVRRAAFVGRATKTVPKAAAAATAVRGRVVRSLVSFGNGNKFLRIVSQGHKKTPRRSRPGWSRRRRTVSVMECRKIAMVGLVAGKANAYAAGYLDRDRTTDELAIRLEIKGPMKGGGRSMACVEIFESMLVRTAVVGDF